MRLNKAVVGTAILANLMFGASTAHAQGKVVVSHDEWFTGTGYFNANEQQFMSNSLGFRARRRELCADLLE